MPKQAYTLLRYDRKISEVFAAAGTVPLIVKALKRRLWRISEPALGSIVNLLVQVPDNDLFEAVIIRSHSAMSKPDFDEWTRILSEHYRRVSVEINPDNTSRLLDWAALSVINGVRLLPYELEPDQERALITVSTALICATSDVEVNTPLMRLVSDKEADIVSAQITGADLIRYIIDHADDTGPVCAIITAYPELREAELLLKLNDPQCHAALIEGAL